MPFQEEEQARLKRQRTRQAIALAMQGRWREAIDVNKSLIESFPNDVDAYNRLGRAHTELGDYPQAKQAYSRALELDPYNTIAEKNLRRLSLLKESVATLESESNRVNPQHFIEEIGKAGVVNLYRLAPPEVLARMVAGDTVYLKIAGPSLVLENGHGEYLGQVDSKHALYLIKLMEGGNRYSAAVISSAEDRMRVIIREVYQHPSQAGRLSFPPKTPEAVAPDVGDRMLRHEVEREEEFVGGPGYNLVDSGEEVFLEEPAEVEDEGDYVE
ncbi:MAG: tetratricopeptide repeat protein [Chloroflexi bacterium]|nr:tetratricopeptide repeat protein [Chloroflexota bacterium]